MTDPQLARAAKVAEAALARGSGDAYDCMVAALGRADRGDRAGAQALFDRALAIDPGDPAVLTGLANWYRKDGRLSEAVRASDAAIAAAPDYPDAWIERGAAYAAGGSSAIARDSYARAAALAPGNPIAHAGFAALAARDGALDEARQAANRALRLAPGSLVAAGTLATVALEQGDPRAACKVLEPALGRTRAGPDRPQALSVLAAARERLGDHDAAFALYTRAKAEFAALHDRELTGLSGLGLVEAVHRGLQSIDPQAWRASAVDAGEVRPNHVFLLGYPRSGTTLVENVLASLQGVEALEERPTLAASDRRFMAGDAAAIAAGLAEFAQLPEADLAPLRAAYWDKVLSAGVPTEALHFVDMDPMKGLHLPFIARLFPEARIVVMRRDPRDVVWSCFKTPFAPTTGTM
jgi:Tfp pilus assembly protein PilF